MKANEFFKKYGWEEASEIVAGIPDKFKFKCLSNTCWDMNIYKYSDRFKPRRSLINMADLKRLVESWELVESYGGLNEAKSDLEIYLFTQDYRLSVLKKAIADVESCQ